MARQAFGLVGIHMLNMRWCTQITNVCLAHLAGIHTLSMDGCTGITDAALAHLAGIHKLRGFLPSTMVVSRALGLPAGGGCCCV